MDRPSANLLIGDSPRPLAMRLALVCAAVAATTAVIDPLAALAPVVSLAVLYLLAVLVISTRWGLGLGLVAAVMSAGSFNWFHLPPSGSFHLRESENWVALAVLLAAAVIASTVAEIARSRTAEAERRREEADLAAALARTLLGGASLDESRAAAARQLASALHLTDASIETGVVAPGAGMVAVPLDVGGGRAASLCVPAGLDRRVMDRLAHRVVPALEAVLAAALERDRLQREVVESQVVRRSDDLKTALLRSVSHDLRTPLTAIIAAGEGMRSPTLAPPERDELAAMVVGAAERLSRLVEQLLDLSRLQAGAAQPRPDWCALDEVVTSAVEHVPGAAAAVTVRMDGDLPLVQADAAQLERVFVNLIENALRFSASAPVEVRGTATAEGVAVSVRDDGPGIPEDELAHVFEPFRRGARHAGHPGAGLGLAIVGGLVEANGGRVSVTSRPGSGSQFTVELPFSAGAPSQVAVPG